MIDRTPAPVDARASRRPGKRRGIALLVSLLVGTLLAVIPASPASAIQTISWTTAPPSSANLGQTVSFAWAGTANTFLGARITGCFVNFPDAPNYSNSFNGSFTTGNCNYTNRVVTTSPNYSIVVGFTLSTGSTMTMSWNISVNAVSPTLMNVPAGNALALTATDPGGAVVPTWNVYGQDPVYGTYSATCSPAAGTVVSAPGTTGSCSATNPAGKTTTRIIAINVAKANPTASWALSSSYDAGTTYASVMTAAVSPSNLQGNWTYTNAGVPVSAGSAIPVANNQTLTATFTPSGTTANNWNAVGFDRILSVVQTAQAVSFVSPPTTKTFGNAPFTVTAVGTAAGADVLISAQAGSACTVDQSGSGTTVSATITLTGGGQCVLLANQPAIGDWTAAPQASWSIAVGKATPTIFLSGITSLGYGETLAVVLDATASVPGTVSYFVNGAPASPATVLDAGAYTISATVTPTDAANYTSASTSAGLTVNKAASSLSVAPMADQTYGRAPVQVSTTTNSPGALTYQGQTAAVCSVSATGLVTSLSSGTCSVRVSQAVTTNYPAAVRTVAFHVARATLVLNWSNPGDLTYGAALGAAQLNGVLDSSSAPYGTPAMGSLEYTYGSGLPADGAVLDAGDQTLIATWTPFSAWASRYNAMETYVTIHVDKAFPTITFPTPADITYGTGLGDDQLNATVDGVTGTFTYTVDGSEDPAAGQVLDAGAHVISALFTPDVLSEGNYLSAVQGAQLVVNQAPQEITFNPGGSHTYGDPGFTISATGGPSGTPVDIAAELGSSCTIAGDTVAITGAGSCVLTASQLGNENYLPAPQVTRSLSIDKATPTLNWVTPPGIPFGLRLDANILNAHLTPANATGQVHYYLGDGVTPADNVQLHAGDRQTLVATYVPDAQGSANFVPVSKVVLLDVFQATQAISFDQLPLTTYGDSDFTVAGTGGGSGLPVTFTATGDACTVSGATVHITSAGTCTVTADQVGNADYLAATSVSRQLVVQRASQTVALAAIAGHTYGDAPFDVDVTPGPSTTPAFTQATGDCTILNATVTITGAGTCSVIATQGGDTNYLPAANATRSFGIAKAGQAITFAPLGTANFADGSVEAQASGGASGNPVTFTATDTACDVVGTTVSIQHAGTCDVTAHQAGARNYEAADAVTRTLTVTPQVLALAWTPSGLTYGDPIGAGQLNASVNPAVPGTWSYSANAGDVLAAGPHTLTATFTPTATGDILPASADVPVTVDKANQTITFGPIADHTFGDAPFGVTATGGASGNPVTFGATTQGCTATPTGTVTITAADGCTIAADQVGTSNFNAAPTVTRSFGVNKAVPTITWSTPDAITYGTALGDAQLTATATFSGQAVAGTIAYGTAAGTVLHASTTPQVLTVTFTPTNGRDFTGATGTTTIVVNRAAQVVDLPAIGDRTYGDTPFGVAATGGASGQPVTVVASGDCASTAAQVTLTGAGACTVTADQAGNGDFDAAASTSVTFAVAKAAGSVTIGSIAAHTYGDAPFTVTATHGASTGAVTWTATGCAITSSGSVSLTAAGTCSVTATQAGDRNHDAAATTQAFAVAKGTQTLTFGALAAKRYGDAPFTVSAAPGASGSPVTFSATGAACTAAGPTVTVVAAGTCTVTANQAGSANYDAAAPVSQALTVNPGTLTVTAQSANRGFHQANPDLTYVVTGYVNGDTSAAITTAPACTTTATVSSAAGTYPITCSGAVSPKYTFTYVAGTLTVGMTATRLTITSPAVQVAGTTTITATLTDAYTGAPINGETVVLTGDLSIKQAQTNPATAQYSFASGLHLIGAIYFGSASYYPAIDAQLLVSYQKTNFVIWGANTGGLRAGDDYTFYGPQWSKQVKQGTNGAGSSFKGYAAAVNAAGTSWSATPSTAAPSTVGDVISVLVTTSTAKSGNTLSGNVTKQVLLHVGNADDYRSNGNVTMTGELLTTL